LKVTKAIAVYLLAVVLLSGLLAPWVFWAVQEAGRTAPGASWLLKYPFRRVFDRTILVVAVAGLWPLWRRLGIRSRAEIGFSRTPRWWRHLLVGVLVGLGSFVVAGGLLIFFDVRRIDPGFRVQAFLARIPGFMLTAIVVALIEETFFRGGLQGVFQRGMKPLAAIAVASVIYSAVHFLKPPSAGIAADTVRWSSGFDHLVRVFAQFGRSQEVGLGFVTLWLVGAILGLAFAKTGALYLPIGLHAGWVLTKQSYGYCTLPVVARGAAWWGGSDLVSNALVWPVLIVVLLLVNWICGPKPGPRR
jgi:membrane protease YdiL (CAAX protease family)